MVRVKAVEVEAVAAARRVAKESFIVEKERLEI
jgi:hypothetical protein